MIQHDPVLIPQSVVNLESTNYVNCNSLDYFDIVYSSLDFILDLKTTF